MTEELETKKSSRSSIGEFNRLLAIAKSFKSKKNVVDYCDMDANDVCDAGKIDSSAIECIAIKIYIIIDRAWNCGVYKWDTSMRSSFYKNTANLFAFTARFYNAVMNYNKKMKEKSDREAAISEKTIKDITKLYETIKYNNMGSAKRQRNKYRKEARKDYGNAPLKSAARKTTKKSE